MEQNISRRSDKVLGSDLPVIDVVPDTSPELTLRDILAMLRRRRTMLVSIFSAGIVAVTVFVFVVTPRYAAKGQLLIDNRAAQIRNINSVIAAPASNLADVPNEVKLLQSRVLAAEVIQKLNLQDDSEFNLSKPDVALTGDGAVKTPKPAAVPDALPVDPSDAIRKADQVVMADQAAARDERSVPEAVAKIAALPKNVTVVKNEATEKNEAAEKNYDTPKQALSEPAGPESDDKSKTAGSSPENGGDRVQAATQGAFENRVPAAILDRFLKRLEASADRRSRVIDVQFESTDPEKAARIVNMLLKVYLANQVRYQKQALTKATERLQKIVDELRGEVDASEIVVQKFRANTRLVDGRGGTNITGQQLGELNSQLVAAQAEETAAKARLDQMLTLLKSEGSMHTAPEILRSVLIQRLREKETELLRQRSEFSSRYGPKHPNMVKISNEIRDLRVKINDESNKIVDSLSNELAVARARVSALTKALTRLETKAISIGKDRNALTELERELESKRQQHQTFLVRLRETSAQSEMIEPTARIVSYAEVPTKPSFPRKGKTLALATMFLALLAAIAAIVAEVMRRTAETTNEVEKALQLQPLGILPRLSKISAILDRPDRMFSNRGNLQLTQSIRNIRSTLYLSNGSREPNSILVTSALPDEGKTGFALSYACFCAANGQRVLLLDCNFTQPSLHKIFSVSNELGVADVLANEDRLHQAIRTMPNVGFDYMTNGQIATGKPELLDAAAMKRLLEAVAWDYDVIIIDSSPVLSVANAHVLGKLVDSTIFIVRWRQTRRDLAAAAVRRLRSLGVSSIRGFIMSDINPRKFDGPDGLIDASGYSDEASRPGPVRRVIRRLGLASGEA